MVEFEFQVITPKVTFDTNAWLNEVRRLAKNSAERSRRAFKSTTKTWKRQPKFYSRRQVGETVSFVAGTDDLVYKWVNDGTKPHIIRPKKAKLLRFRSEYSAKTSPKVIGSRPGGSYGPFVVAKMVKHPGTEARDFVKEIRKKEQARFIKELNTSFQKFAQRARRD